MTAQGFERVPATAEEMAAYRAAHATITYRPGYYPSVHRVRCLACGRRMWGSGLAIGSHRRACKGAPTPLPQSIEPMR